MPLSLRMQKLHVDSLVVLHWVVFLKTRLLCATHYLHCLAGYFFFPSPPATIFSSLCILEFLESLPGGSCLGPLGVVCFSGNWRSSEFDLVLFWTYEMQDLPTSCRKLLYFIFFLFIFSFLYTKNALKMHSLADTIPPLSTILLFSLELSNNWGTGLPYLCPSWIHCVGQWCKAFLFPGFFFLSFLSVFAIVSSWIIHIICTRLSSCPSTLGPLCRLSSGTLTAIFVSSRSHRMPVSPHSAAGSHLPL